MLQSFRTTQITRDGHTKPPAGAITIDKASVSLDQWTDGPVSQGDVDGTGKFDENWLHGNLNPQKAHYNEGDSVPYRAILDNLTTGVRYGLVIQWDTVDSGGYAIDYLTGYNYAFEGTKHPGEPDADPLKGVRGISSSNVTLAAIQADPQLLTGFGAQYGSTDGLGSGQPSGARSVSLFGAVSDATVSETTYSDDNSKASVTVWFTYTGSRVNSEDAVVVAWGGHIASAAAWDDDPSDNVITASGISGSPYHMRVLNLVENDTVVSVGNQDRSMQSGVVIVPPPTPNDASVTADEDNIALIGNNDTTSPGDDAQANLTGTLSVTDATDVNFASLSGNAVLDTGGLAVTSGGHALTYYWDAAGATLYAATDASSLAQAQATAAFEIALSGTSHLDYAFSLLKPVDHPAGEGTPQDNTEDPNVNIDITYTAVDGTTATAVIHVTIDDDMPIRAASPTAVTAEVREDGMATPEDLSDGNRDGGSTSDDEASGIAGSLAALVSFGADGEGSMGMSTDTSGLPDLYSNGVKLDYAVTDFDTDGIYDTLTATAGTSPDVRTVFTLHIGADGSSWEFDLQDQLDHVAANDENSDLITALGGATHVAAIDFSSIVLATDGDGDTVAPLNAGDFAITVRDDIPVQVADATMAGAVYEDAMTSEGGDLSEGSGASGEPDGDEVGSSSEGMNTLAALLAVGADEPALFGLLTDTSALPDLYSQGVPVEYAVTDEDADGVYDTLTATAGTRTVFTLVVGTDGSWNFDIDDQLDHVAGSEDSAALITSADGSTYVESIDFSSIVQVTDDDGDSQGLTAGTFTVAVQDDMPMKLADATPVTAEVKEEGMSLTASGDAGDLSEGNRGTRSRWGWVSSSRA